MKAATMEQSSIVVTMGHIERKKTTFRAIVDNLASHFIDLY
ncbi:hypothetical protein ACVWZR_002092 [Bradyrhizobium sp. i1.3.1]